MNSISVNLILGTLFLCFVSVSAAAESSVADSVLQNRLESSKSSLVYVKRLSPAGKKVLDGLYSQSKQLGRMQSLSEVEAHLSVEDAKISNDDYWNIMLALRWAQKPEVSTKELLRLVGGYRDSLPSPLWIKYRLDDYSAIRDESYRTLHSQCFFGMENEKLYYSETTGIDTKVMAFDGKFVGSMDIQDDVKSQNRGVIKKLELREAFIRTSNPLRFSKLLDTARDLGVHHPEEELFQTIAQYGIWETKEEFAGQECIVLGYPGIKYFLSPAHGFAIIGHRGGAYEFDTTLGRLVKQPIAETKDFGDFVSIADGVFLPKSYEHKVYRSGKISLSFTISIDEISTEKPLVFEFQGHDLLPSPFQVITPGTYTIDSVRNATDIQGIAKKMEAGLPAAPKAAPSRHLFLAANVMAVLMLILGFIAFRRYTNS